MGTWSRAETASGPMLKKSKHIQNDLVRNLVTLRGCRIQINDTGQGSQDIARRDDNMD